MSGAGDAFGYFLIEYKKRLPDDESNKDFHNHIDYMIRYFRSNSVIYQDRWDDWISPNDERYWRMPNKSESELILKKHVEKEDKYQQSGIFGFIKVLFKLMPLL